MRFVAMLSPLPSPLFVLSPGKPMSYYQRIVNCRRPQTRTRASSSMSPVMTSEVNNASAANAAPSPNESEDNDSKVPGTIPPPLPPLDQSNRSQLPSSASYPPHILLRSIMVCLGNALMRAIMLLQNSHCLSGLCTF
ncbi:hypothetical protein HJC23_001207 [Cyclotella cryptica]|uniref:Uncharacterized protein n=1 Tax=Cyclotella cryptica TaxID=29204 RepID=A0ABD3QPC2_9STRA